MKNLQEHSTLWFLVQDSAVGLHSPTPKDTLSLQLIWNNILLKKKPEGWLSNEYKRGKEKKTTSKWVGEAETQPGHKPHHHFGDPQV